MPETLTSLTPPPEHFYPTIELGNSAEPAKQANPYIEQIDRVEDEVEKEDFIYGLLERISDLHDGLATDDTESVNAALQLADAFVACMPIQPRGSEWGDVLEAQMPVLRIINRFKTLNRPDIATRYEPLLTE